MDIDYFATGKRIKTARIQADITQQSLAEITQLSISHVSNIEHGKTKLGLPTIIKIANALSVSIDSLVIDNLIPSSTAYLSEFSKLLLEDCSKYEVHILERVLRETKAALRNNARFINEETSK